MLIIQSNEGNRRVWQVSENKHGPLWLLKPKTADFLLSLQSAVIVAFEFFWISSKVFIFS